VNLVTLEVHSSINEHVDAVCFIAGAFLERKHASLLHASAAITRALRRAVKRC
jgi:hypothetical protein